MFGLTVDKSSDMPLFRQVYMQIRDLILEGRVKAGEKIPSTRELAADLGVSRNVILEAYSLLMAEDYIQSRQGAGTRVAEGACFRRTKEVPSPLENVVPAPVEAQKDVIDFRSGVPALDVFPLKQWGRTIHQICLESSGTLLTYNAPEGNWELRRTLSEYLFRARGITCNPEQIIITSGATQGLALIAKLLFLPGAEVVTEDPVHIGVWKIASNEGYRLLHVPVDAHGLQTNLLTSKGTVPRFIYVTPSHQFPLGGILPIQRRIELTTYARDNDCFIVEDDYDSEYRYEGPPLSALQWLDPERVIYLGSFSKIMAPALRLGYVIIPAKLMDRCRELKRYSDVHTPSLDQLALARFIKEGRLERHVARMKRVYASRRRTIREALNYFFPGENTVFGDSTGLHLIAEFPGVEFTDEVVEMLMQNGVRVYPVDNYALRKGRHKNKVILGYGHLDSEQIAKGIQRLRFWP
ncbi:MAG: PLP-dependent aminotransferase family protein [Firmicutes bacterium]|nr:PLP-dependent aminotransferase family protein [Bacillota bacterium]